MPKSRGRKPKKKRAPASAPKKRLDNFNTTPQEAPLPTQPPQEPPLATAPRQEQPTPKIKQIAKLTTLTGGLASSGKAHLLSKQIWAEEINAKGGLLGRPVKLFYYDDQ